MNAPGTSLPRLLLLVERRACRADHQDSGAAASSAAPLCDTYTPTGMPYSATSIGLRSSTWPTWAHGHTAWAASPHDHPSPISTCRSSLSA